jgi:hypothetical protein
MIPVQKSCESGYITNNIGIIASFSFPAGIISDNIFQKIGFIQQMLDLRLFIFDLVSQKSETPIFCFGLYRV